MNTILFLVLVIFFSLTLFWQYRQQREVTLEEATEKARIIASEANRTRGYLSAQLEQGQVELSADRYGMIPVVAANRIGQLVAKDLDYTIRHTSLRYRNPQNAPDSFEITALEQFQKNPALTEIAAITEWQNQTVFRYLHSAQADKSCMTCHGDPTAAPAFLREIFPVDQDQAYHYQLDQVIGAVSVIIPMQRLEAQMTANLRSNLTIMGGIFLALTICLGLLTRQTVLQPLRRLASSIGEITRTGRFTEQLPNRAGGEIGQLIDGFNDMMTHIDEKTANLEESEQRFRLLTELARDAIIAFVPAGQIFLFNHQAERMFGYSQRELLGAPIDRLLHEECDGLQTSVAETLAGANDAWLSELHRIAGRRCDGTRIDLEVSVAIIETGERPFYTAILRQMN
jgi:PAS domain S-box-containing protein